MSDIGDNAWKTQRIKNNWSTNNRNRSKQRKTGFPYILRHGKIRRKKEDQLCVKNTFSLGIQKNIAKEKRSITRIVHEEEEQECKEINCFYCKENHIMGDWEKCNEYRKKTGNHEIAYEANSILGYRSKKTYAVAAKDIKRVETMPGQRERKH